jgi:uncharacterized membrane protein
VLKALKNANRLGETLLLGSLAALCFGLSLFRWAYSGSPLFLFLNWNLFLAGVPWIVTSVTLLRGVQKSKIAVFILLGLWLLFFPNAPYILTDLIHLRLVTTMPIWFDLVLILSFAWTGLLFGFLSLWDIENLLKKKLAPLPVKLIAAALLFVGGFGVYLGRYLRWNSWDLITRPFPLFYDIGERFFNPREHQAAWGMTLFMGLFLNMVYWSLRFLRKRGSLPAGLPGRE